MEMKVNCTKLCNVQAGVCLVQSYNVHGDSWSTHTKTSRRKSVTK